MGGWHIKEERWGCPMSDGVAIYSDIPGLQSEDSRAVVTPSPVLLHCTQVTTIEIVVGSLQPPGTQRDTSGFIGVAPILGNIGCHTPPASQQASAGERRALSTSATALASCLGESVTICPRKCRGESQRVLKEGDITRHSDALKPFD